MFFKLCVLVFCNCSAINVRAWTSGAIFVARRTGF